MCAKALDLSLPYQIADIALADFGKKEMQLSERESLSAAMARRSPSRDSRLPVLCI